MSEFSYSGKCPNCGEHSTFVGGVSRAWCEKCEAQVVVNEIMDCVILGME